MFSWFKPTCPVEPLAKQWVENRSAWLSAQFGLDVFVRRSMILPLQEYFPEQYDGSEKAVQILINQVCGYMDVDPRRVELRFFKAPTDFWLVNDRGQYVPTSPAGLYEEGYSSTVIHIESSQFMEPMDLVGTTAHELAHLRLLGEKRVSSEVYDNELLTDLTVVFHGLGIFLANSPRAWASQFTTWPDSQVRKPEYMTAPMFGYALAHSAWFREERKPSWARFLRPDARAALKQGLRYLWETQDSTFKPVHAR